MDAILSAALEEICARGSGGIPVSSLWPALAPALSSSGLPSSAAVKKALWARLLALPGLRFQSRTGARIEPRDPSIQSLDESETIGLVIVAEEHLRDSFVGLYDRKAAGTEIPAIQRRALERLAAARTDGITQSELAKEFGIKGNNIFYVVRNLESQQLIVRQSTIIRAKESGMDGENGPKNTSVVNTNLMHLYRYANNLSLNSQQRIEITKPDMSENNGSAGGSSLYGNDVSGEYMKKDVCVKDFLPEMRAICDKLEEASGKVLVVSDIKLSLGYRKTHGHRAWRNILNRLKEASLVEECQAKVNCKVVTCLRLLKKFDPNDFLPKIATCGYDGFDSEQITKHGKRGQITDQILELPLEHRIYDMIDAEGTKGITISEVCKRLGLNAKKIYTRIIGMCSRFGMHLQAEIHDRTPLYRVWTVRNYQHNSTNIFTNTRESIPDRNELTKISRDLISYEQPSQDPQLLHSTSTNDILLAEKTQTGKIDLETSSGNKEHSQGILPEKIPCNLGEECTYTEDVDLGSGRCAIESSFVMTVADLSTPSISLNDHVVKRYHRASSTAIGARREQRILERLKNEKFILTVELYRWLEGLEKDKPTTMARKTLNRTLNKLQEEGLCKCIQVSIPVVTNFSRTRATEVILHPSVETLTSEFVDLIYKSQRRFDIEIRRGSIISKNNQPLTTLSGLKKSSNRVDDKPVILEAMRANGFVTAKMVRAKLLHNFLWGYLSTLPDWHNVLNSNGHGFDGNNPHNTCHFFALGEAIKSMPLQLFLQIVGSATVIDGMVEHCRLGSRLLDLNVQEYKCLVNTQATGRLSSIINILLRLKLIRLVREGIPEGANMVPHAILTHAMELKPYIEEPLSRALPSSNANELDRHPRIRHDFSLTNQEAVNAYWETLEYCYAAADPETATHVFPGSSVHEAFLPRSWTAVRVMTYDQRSQLGKRLTDEYGKKQKMSFRECQKIAKELSVSVEQVLRVHYDKCHFRIRKPNSLEQNEQEDHRHGRKRKRMMASVHTKVDAGTRELAEPIMTSDADNQNLVNTLVPFGDHDNEFHESDDDIINNDAVSPELHEENDDSHALFSQYVLPRPARKKRFSWDDDSDRQLVMQYARHRATLGARFYRVEWASLSDLPAPSDACRRRMALLNSDKSIRKAVMRLCDLLGERYSRYLGKTYLMQENELLRNDSENSNQSLMLEGTFAHKLSATQENACILDSNLHRWDDFEDPNIKMAADEVIQYKKMAKLEHVKKFGSRDGKEWPDISPSDGINSKSQECVVAEQNKVSKDYGNGISSYVEGQRENVPNIGRRKTGPHYHHKKFLKLLSRRDICIRKQVRDSLAVSNAIELLKLMFLSTSSSLTVQASLTAMLRLYAECDLFAAFNYLQDMNFMVIGHGSRPFVLSQKFWTSASSSQFPIDSGERAAKFSRWLQKQEKELTEAGAILPSDLQCGEIFNLFALIAMGGLFISPCLPAEGIGEPDEPKSSKTSSPMEDVVEANSPKSLKRKPTNDETNSGEKVKKCRSQGKMDADFCSRREKGFPGIKVLLNSAKNSRDDPVMCLTDGENLSYYLSYEEITQQNPYPTMETISVASLPSYLNLYDSFSRNDHPPISQNESPWDAMTNYAAYLSSKLTDMNQVNFSPEIFKYVHSKIHGAGEQGLNMEEISEAMEIKGLQSTSIVVHTLEAFKLAIKVNAYDSVRVVDSSYRSKFLITMVTECNQDEDRMSCMKSSQLFQEKHHSVWNPKNDTSMDISDGHKVTILGLRSEPSSSLMERQPSENSTPFEGCLQSRTAHLRGSKVGFKNYPDTGVQVSWPILPWINGDGSINNTVYRGLSRRVLGTVMQNPGILQEDIISCMDVLNPQSCRQLLESMILDNHIIVRTMRQQISAGPPPILQSLLCSDGKKSESVLRKHYFANPMSTALL